jgi:hypothetical protein
MSLNEFIKDVIVNIYDGIDLAREATRKDKFHQGV